MNNNFADVMVLVCAFSFCIIIMWDVIVDTIEIKKDKALQKK